MKSFKQFITESANGNYTSIDVAKQLPDFKIEPVFGGSKLCDFSDQHVTLMYSKNTSVPLKTVQKYIDNLPKKVHAKVSGVEAFDSLPKEGERDAKLCTIVLTLDSTELDNIHKGLAKLGLQHSYPNFEAHISLIYDLPIEDKEKAISLIKSKKAIGIDVELSGYKNDVIRKDWSDKLGTK